MTISMTFLAFSVFFISVSFFLFNVPELIATNLNDHGGIVESTAAKKGPKKYEIGRSSDHLMWFLQISDLHISQFHNPDRVTELREFCDKTVRVFDPLVVIASGDITDAKSKNLMDSKQNLEEWKSYKRVLDETGIANKILWMDMRGNHDNFNLISLKSPENLFTNYSVQGHKNPRSYMYTVPKGSEKYSFIGVDACMDPGPRRPFDFLGYLDNKEINKIDKLLEESRRQGSDYNIWFGHFPSSCILSENRSIRDVISGDEKGMVYLCGHLHTMAGLVPEMYTLQRGEYLELELADWKKNRRFRLGAIDHGQYSFVDVEHGRWPVVLVTNPKNALYSMPRRESIQSVADSTHIRVLAFSIDSIINVSVKIDNGNWIKCDKLNDTQMFVAKWDPSLYGKGLHEIFVRAIDEKGRKTETGHEFSLDGTQLSFKFLANLVVRTESNSFQSFITIIFVILLAISVIPLLIVKIYRYSCITERMQIPQWQRNGLMRKLGILSSIDFLFYPIIFYPLYIALGPWSFGKIIEDEFGVIFAWGIYVGDASLPGSLCYLFASMQLLLFHIPLTIIIVHILDRRLRDINKPLRKTTRPFQFIWKHLAILLLIIKDTILAFLFWLAYGTIATLLCPFMTWTVIMTLILGWYANYLPNRDLKSAAFIWSSPRHSIE